MLPKEKRLNLKTNFRWVASGRSFTSGSFKFFYRFGDNKYPKIGVSIISAQFKKSTIRNQVKRICFNLADTVYAQLPKNINLVIMPRAQVLDTDHQILLNELQNAIYNFKTN